MTRLYLVDDHAVLREELRHLCRLPIQMSQLAAEKSFAYLRVR
jgi:hypothetical protein